MLQKINLGILITAVTLFCYGFYTVFVNGEIYPNSFLLFYSFLCSSAYFSLHGIRAHHTKIYKLFSLINLINISILIADYFYLDLLKNTWNFSFALIFLQLLVGFLLRIKSFKGKVATTTFWSTLFTTCLIEIMIVFKISNHYLHTTIIYSFIISSVLILVLFGMKLRRKHQ
jgi:hypothetical protein